VADKSGHTLPVPIPIKARFSEELLRLLNERSLVRVQPPQPVSGCRVAQLVRALKFLFTLIGAFFLIVV